MKTLRLSLMTLAAFAGSAFVNAEEAPAEAPQGNVSVPDRAIVLTGGQNGVNSQVMTVLYDTSDVHFQDPEAPRFLLIDREGKTVFGIGGYVEGVAQYDFLGAIDNAGFDTYDINVPADPSLHNRLGADMTRTNIFMQLVTRTRWGVLSAYAQGNFAGAGGAFKLKQAYVRLHNVLGGLTRSTFQDALSGVPTIDYQGPSGAVSVKNVQIRYSYNFNRNFSAAIAAEMPGATYTTRDGINKMISQRVPDIPAYVQYQWDGGKSHIRLSGLFRQLSYRNLLTGENKFATGWAAQVSGAVKCTGVATLFYQAAYGKGYGRYMNDLGGNGFDLVYDAEGGNMEAPAALGIVGGVRFNLAHNVFLSGSYSFDRVYDVDHLGADTYRRANYAVANCFWTPIPDLQLGIEYLHGRRTDISGADNTANRIEAMVKYSF